MLPPPQQSEGSPSIGDKADHKGDAAAAACPAAPAAVPAAAGAGAGAAAGARAGAAAAAAVPNYDHQLGLLLEMGYNDSAMLTDLLSLAKGNVELVCTWMASAEPRKVAKAAVSRRQS